MFLVNRNAQTEQLLKCRTVRILELVRAVLSTGGQKASLNINQHPQIQQYFREFSSENLPPAASKLQYHTSLQSREDWVWWLHMTCSLWHRQFLVPSMARIANSLALIPFSQTSELLHIYLMAVKNRSSPKITEVTQCLIFHPYSLVIHPLIINQPSHTLKVFSNLSTYKKMTDFITETTPQNRVKTQKGSLNLLKNLNFAFLAQFWSKQWGQYGFIITQNLQI